MKERRTIGHYYRWNNKVLVDQYKDKYDDTVFTEIYFPDSNKVASLNKLISASKHKDEIIETYRQLKSEDHSEIDARYALYDKYFSDHEKNRNIYEVVTSESSDTASNRYKSILHGQKSFYKIFPSHEVGKTGVAFPQIDNFKDTDDLTKDDYRKFQKLYNASIDELPLNNFLLKSDAFLTDVLSSRFLILNGFFVNEKAKDILQSFQLEKTEFHPSKIFHKNQSLSYYFMQVLECDCIDFEKSKFTLKKADFDKNGEELTFTSQQRLDEEADRLFDTGSEYDIFNTHITLKKDLDLFKSPRTNDFLASEDLIGELLNKNVTGFDYESPRYEVKL